MKQLLALILVIGIGAGWAPARAESTKLQLPKKDYVADVVMSWATGEKVNLKMYYTKDRVRMDMIRKGQPIAMIVDRPAKKVTMLLLNQNMYVKIPLRDDLDFFSKMRKKSASSVFAKVGEETVGGQRTTKYKFSGKNKSKGHIWVTDDWIWMKIAGVREKNGKKTAFNWETKKLTIGPVDAATFAVPDGFLDAAAAMKKKQQ